MRYWVIFSSFLLLLFFIGIIIISLFTFFAFDLPSLKALSDYEPPLVSKVYSDDYELIGKFFDEDRSVIPFSEIPVELRHAIISAEDAHFYHHKGIDPWGIIRATAKNILAQGIRQGGSTITQQVAKTFLLTKEKTFSRKIKEFILANRIEKNFSKDQILYLYLNQIYFGHGSYGVGAASKNYFNKDVSALNLAEIALLAGLPQAPSLYSPFKNPEKAKKRQKYVLKRMFEESYISREAAQQALAAEISIAPKEDINLSVAPYFLEHVRKYLVEKYGNDEVLKGGLKVYTTVSASLQHSADKAVKYGLEQLSKRQGYRGPLRALNEEEITMFMKNNKIPQPKLLNSSIRSEAVVVSVDDIQKYVQVFVHGIHGKIRLEDMVWASPFDPKASHAALISISSRLKRGDVIIVCYKEQKNNTFYFYLEDIPLVQGAFIALDPHTGYVKALVGGYDFSASEFNRATQAMRQPGSAFKPIIYASALDKGYTPTTIIIDSPIIYDDPSREFAWKPTNYSMTFHGDTTFRSSLIHSLNITTIKIVQDIGIDYVTEYAKKLGVHSPLTQDLSLSLGSSAVTLEELVTAYAHFPSLGRKVEPIYIKRVEDRYGRVLENNVSEDAGENSEEQIQSFQKETVKRIEEMEHERAVMNELADLKSTGESISHDIMGKVPARDLPLPSGSVISPETAYIMTHLLRGVIQEGTGQSVRSLDRPAAGKTGTTNEYKDAWFIGFTPELVAGAWVGFDEITTLGKGETGATAASPIWLAFMQEAVQTLPKRDFKIPPKTIVFTSIDPKTGKRVPPHTKNSLTEAFREGTLPPLLTPAEKQKEKNSVDDFFLEE